MITEQERKRVTVQQLTKKNISKRKLILQHELLKPYNDKTYKLNVEYQNTHRNEVMYTKYDIPRCT